MKIIIIEDEPRTATNLKNNLETIEPDIDVPEIIDSVETGVSYFEENGYPDLIFSDIQIADGLSFEIFARVYPTCPVIFCTAYDQYAIQAFKANGIDYLLKPFSEDDVKRAIGKFKSLTRPSVQKDALIQLFEQLQQPKRQSILVNYRDKIIPVNLKAVSFFYATNHITLIYSDGKELIINYTLDELERIVDPGQFYRANRQFIINRDYIKEIEHYFARKLVVFMTTKTPESVIVSKGKASSFLKWMQGI